MVRVSGSLRFVTDNPAQVSEVWVRAPRVRTHAGGVVTTGNDRFPVDGGEVSFTAVPGPAVLALISQGRAVDTIPILVPERDASLEECVRAAGDADEYSRRELEEMVWEVREAYPLFQAVSDRTVEAARRASQSEQNAAGSEQRAKQSEQNAKTSEVNAGSALSGARSAEQGAKTAESNARTQAGAAASSASAAKTSEQNTKTSEGNASKSASAAAAAETNAGRSASAAGVSAGNAKTSETNAARSATAAGTSETNAGKAARDAQSSATAAATSETNSAEHASKAARHEVAAQGHAGDAATSAESAKADAERAATIAGSTRWVGTQVEVNGKRSPDLMPTLEVSPRGTWVINGVDTGAQARGPGGTSSWAGITDKPEVFPPAEHTHHVDDLDGIDEFTRDFGDALYQLEERTASRDHTHTLSQITDAPNSHTSNNAASTLVSRDSAGRARVNNPVVGLDIANKQYVDTVVFEGPRDSGWRRVDGNAVSLSDMGVSGFQPGGGLLIRRVGKMVTLRLRGANVNSTQKKDNVGRLPDGFRSSTGSVDNILAPVYMDGMLGDQGQIGVREGHKFQFWFRTTGDHRSASLTWVTDDPWPTTLPGTPA